MTNEHKLKIALVVCGVYAFRHRSTGLCYVGSSKDIHARRKSHLLLARRGSNRYFHKRLRELGEESFDFEILEVCAEGVRLEREKYFIALIRSTYPNGFNLYKDPTNGWDYHFSDAVRKKIGDANRGRVCSAEFRLKMSRINKGKTLSAEHREKIRDSGKKNSFWRGKNNPFTPEWKASLSRSAAGRKLSEETKQKLRVFQLARQAALREQRAQALAKVKGVEM